MDSKKKTIVKVRKFKKKRASHEFGRKDKNTVDEIKIGNDLLNKENDHAKAGAEEEIELKPTDLHEEIEIQDIKQLCSAGKCYEKIKELEKYLLPNSDLVKLMQSLHQNIRLPKQQKLEKIKNLIKGQPINDLELYYVRLLIADINPKD